MREVGVYRLQVFCAWSLVSSQARVVYQFVGKMTLTAEPWDKKRADDLEEYLTVEREPANVVTDIEDFLGQGKERDGNLTQGPVPFIST